MKGKHRKQPREWNKKIPQESTGGANISICQRKEKTETKTAETKIIMYEDGEMIEYTQTYFCSGGAA
jgi:hypothetical protein